MANETSRFGGLLTDVGIAKQIATNAQGVPWEIDRMQLGDAGGEPGLFPDPVPSPGQTELVNARHTIRLNGLYPSPVDKGVLIAEAILPPDVGGFWIREASLLDEDGDMIAVAIVPPSFKPLLTQGSGRTQTIRLHVLFGNTANVRLTVDPSMVFAMRDYVDAQDARSRARSSHTGEQAISTITGLAAALAALAPLDSPALTGTPTAPTASAGTNSTQIATTAFVRAAVAALVNSSPATLDTLQELAAALGNDPNFATTMTNALANKVDKVTGKGLSTNDFTAALLTKLNGIAAGATANATDAQLRARSTHTGEQAISTVTGLAAALAALAPLASPALTGTPTAPTAAAGTNSTQIATTAFVRAAIAALVGSSPAALDTLNELAAALGNDPNFATTMTNALANKVDKVAGKGLSTNDFTAALLTKLNGIAAGATANATDAQLRARSTHTGEQAISTITGLAAALAALAPLASPALTGIPTAPTAPAGTNSTQIATTAFVRAALAALVGSSPAALDTLNELAAALGNDPNFATTMTNALAGKLGKTETAAKAAALASNIVINGVSVNAGSNATITAEATAASVMAANAAAAVGAVGTYAFLLLGGQSTGVRKEPGSTVAGSSCKYTAVDGTGSASPAGTWSVMGWAGDADGGGQNSVTLCKRIA